MEFIMFSIVGGVTVLGGTIEIIRRIINRTNQLKQVKEIEAVLMEENK
jgi:hypothetical protein